MTDKVNAIPIATVTAIRIPNPSIFIERKNSSTIIVPGQGISANAANNHQDCFDDCFSKDLIFFLFTSGTILAISINRPITLIRA